MAWVDQSSAFGYGTKLTSTQMQNLRDNLTAFANQDSGAPTLANNYITSSMIGSNIIGADHINNSSININKLDTSELSFKINRYAAGEGSSVGLFLLNSDGYSFFPRLKFDQASWGLSYDAYGKASLPDSYGYGTYYAYIQLEVHQSSYSGVNSVSMGGKHMYVTSSGEVYWIFLLRDKATKQIISSWAAPDHPCFGNTNNPDIVYQPFGHYDPNKHEIIVINPDEKKLNEINDNFYNRPEKDFFQSCFELYEIDEQSNVKWTDKEITIGVDRKKMRSIKRKIPKHKNIKQAALIRKK